MVKARAKVHYLRKTLSEIEKHESKIISKLAGVELFTMGEIYGWLKSNLTEDLDPEDKLDIAFAYLQTFSTFFDDEGGLDL